MGGCEWCRGPRNGAHRRRGEEALDGLCHSSIAGDPSDGPRVRGLASGAKALRVSHVVIQRQKAVVVLIGRIAEQFLPAGNLAVAVAVDGEECRAVIAIHETRPATPSPLMSKSTPLAGSVSWTWQRASRRPRRQLSGGKTFISTHITPFTSGTPISSRVRRRCRRGCLAISTKSQASDTVRRC